MATFIIMPKLGLTMTEGTVSDWKKKPGENVKEGEPLFDVETDKLTNTIESTASGTLLKIVAEVGDTIACLEPVAIIGEAGEDISSLAVAPSQTQNTQTIADTKNASVSTPAAPVREPGARVLASPRAKKLALEMGIDISLVSGTGPGGRIVEDDIMAYKATSKEIVSEDTKVKASPLATLVSEDLGISLDELKKDEGGRVFVEDILAYLKSKDIKAAATDPLKEEIVKMNGMRRAIAKNMLESHLTSPTVTFNLGVDMSELKNMRAQLKAKEIKVSYTDLIVKIVSKALIEYPQLNCSVEDQKIILKHYVNMGVAVAVDNGLLVPNITNADKKSITEISTEIKELAALAREGKLPMEKLRGGTFTITNLGMYGIDSFSPIINQPEIAILGITGIKDSPVVRDGQIVIRPMMNLCLTADHRAVDGAVAAEFLQRVAVLMENPLMMLV